MQVIASNTISQAEVNYCLVDNCGNQSSSPGNMTTFFIIMGVVVAVVLGCWAFYCMIKCRKNRAEEDEEDLKESFKEPLSKKKRSKYDDN